MPWNQQTPQHIAKNSITVYHRKKKKKQENETMRLTMKNHRSDTYRASLIRIDNNCAIGDVVNKLGRYEDICDDPEKLKKMIQEKGIPEQ